MTEEEYIARYGYGEPILREVSGFRKQQGGLPFFWMCLLIAVGCGGGLFLLTAPAMLSREIEYVWRLLWR